MWSILYLSVILWITNQIFLNEILDFISYFFACFFINSSFLYSLSVVCVYFIKIRWSLCYNWLSRLWELWKSITFRARAQKRKYINLWSISLTLIWGEGGGGILPPGWFFCNNSKTVKAVTLAFCSEILLETFVPNLVSLTCPNLWILSKAQTGVFPISWFLVNPL